MRSVLVVGRFFSHHVLCHLPNKKQSTPRFSLVTMYVLVIKTAMTKSWFEDEMIGAKMDATTPLKKSDNLGDVAKAAVFLASGKEAGWITGVPMPIDGGFLAQ